MKRIISVLLMCLLLAATGTAFGAGDTVELFGKEFPADAADIDLRRLGITKPGDISGIEELTELRTVDLRGREMTLEEMNAFAAAYPDIRFYFSFELAGVSTGGRTRVLDLSGKKIESTDLIRSYMPFLPELEKLVMCDCGIADSDMAALRDEISSRTKLVWTVHLGVYSLRTDAEVFTTHRGDPPEEELNDESAYALRYCTGLKALDLGHHALSDLSFLDEMPELRVLILADNKISDLEPLTRLENLHYLEIFLNDGFESFEPLSRCRGLRSLNVSWCDNAVDYEYLLELENLHRLWIVGAAWWPAMDEFIAGVPEGTEICMETGGGATDYGWRDGSLEYRQLREMFKSGRYSEYFDFAADK